VETYKAVDVQAHTFSRYWFIADSEVVSLRHWLPYFPPTKIPDTFLSQRLNQPQGYSGAGKIKSIEKSMNL
jgi:hypothetical protein